MLNDAHKIWSVKKHTHAAFLFCAVLNFFRNRIVSVGAPGVAAGNSFRPQPDSSENAPLANGLNSIL